MVDYNCYQTVVKGRQIMEVQSHHMEGMWGMCESTKRATYWYSWTDDPIC